MATPVKRGRFLKWALLFVLGVPVLVLVASEFGLPLPGDINCETADVDIQTGRIRHARTVFFVPFGRRVEDSALTKALPAEDVSRAVPDWHRVNTFRPGSRISPHHGFHGAISQMRTLEQIWQLARFTPAAQRASARRLLDLWQQSGDSSRADEYIRALGEIAGRVAKTSGTIDEGDLPPP